MAGNAGSGHIYTVSGLTRELKSLIEDRYPFVWITGEISNFTVPSSGHAYFSLKDSGAIIPCVMFRNQRKRLRFHPENGMSIIGMGRISLYEPRGAYQLIFEHLEPEGTGALQAAFEQLKLKLDAEGLFDAQYKKTIPAFPSKISVITSPTGAVIRDIIQVATRRFPNCNIEILPVKVQGDGAVEEIVAALGTLNSRSGSQVILLARGGGSLEDLMAFNSEPVARAIFQSEVPVISAIGHETDYSIADFVADLRAPTPSAAAELAVPDKTALISDLSHITRDLSRAIQNLISALKNKASDLKSRLKSPERYMDDMRFRLEDLETRLRAQTLRVLQHKKQNILWLNQSLHAFHPGKQIRHYRTESFAMKLRLESATRGLVEKLRSDQLEQASLLTALNPMAVLERGYSITRTHPGHSVIMDAIETRPGDSVEVILNRGKLHCRIEEAYGKEENL